MNLLSGNSIMAGYSASAPSKSFAALYAAATGKQFVNVAVSGAMVQDQTSAIYARPLSVGDSAAIFLGTNDDRMYNNDPVKQTLFIDGYRALVVYQAAARKDARTAARLNGDWYDNIYSGHGLGIAATQAGSKVQFSFTGDVLYLGMIRQAGNDGRFTVSENGTVKGAYSLGGSGQTFFQQGTSLDYGPKCIRVAGFGAGSHTVVLEVLSNRVYFDWWADTTKAASVLVGNIPKARPDANGNYQSGGSESSVLANNAAIVQMVSQLKADGLNVSLWDVCSRLTLADMDTGAGYHPIDSGHQKMLEAATGIPQTPQYTYTLAQIYQRSDGLFFVGDGPNKKKLLVEN